MKLKKTSLAIALIFGATLQASAQIGPNLTPWGAEAGANKDGSIPAYTGGIKNGPKIPASGIMPNPFPEDKVLYTIDASNMAKYLDKLTPGTQALMKKYPGFKLSVYPTRRSVNYPQHVLDNTAKNMTRCGLLDNGDALDVSKGCARGIPFPVPKNGYEAMWNHNGRYYGPGRISMPSESSYIKANGERVVTSIAYSYNDNGLYHFDGDLPKRHWSIRVEYTGPARIVGQGTVIYDEFDGARKSYSYQPATRRVRLAPDLAADTPIGTAGGATTYDEMNMFSGTMDRWDMKLVGKKDIYIPYHVYDWGQKPGCTKPDELFGPGHPKMECVRFELHRVWHVQATLKPGKRHIYGMRDYYYDEDGWYGGAQEQWDKEGKMYRMQYVGLMPNWEKQVPLGGEFSVSFDLNSGVYFASKAMGTYILDKPLAASIIGPERLSTPVLTAPK